jgi:Protein of unknown function (DUF1275)
VVLLAFGAAGAQGLPVLAPTVSLVVFLAGATAGGRLAHRLVGPAGAQVPAPQRRRWVMIVLLAELLLVAVAGVAALGLPVDGGGARRYGDRVAGRGGTPVRPVRLVTRARAGGHHLGAGSICAPVTDRGRMSSTGGRVCRGGAPGKGCRDGEHQRAPRWRRPGVPAGDGVWLDGWTPLASRVAAWSTGRYQ